MSNQYKVGERIRMYREQLEMSVADLSAKSGVSEEIINAIEASEVIPALGVLTKVSRALGQRLGTFMDDQFKDLSGIRHNKSCYHIEACGLTRSVRTEKTYNLTLVHFHGNPFHNCSGAIFLNKVFAT